MVIAYCILRDGTIYQERGGDFYDQLNAVRTRQRLMERLRRMGVHVTISAQPLRYRRRLHKLTQRIRRRLLPHWVRLPCLRPLANRRLRCPKANAGAGVPASALNARFLALTPSPLWRLIPRRRLPSPLSRLNNSGILIYLVDSALVIIWSFRRIVVLGCVLS